MSYKNKLFLLDDACIKDNRPIKMRKISISERSSVSFNLNQTNFISTILASKDNKHVYESNPLLFIKTVVSVHGVDLDSTAERVLIELLNVISSWKDDITFSSSINILSAAIPDSFFIRHILPTCLPEALINHDMNTKTVVYFIFFITRERPLEGVHDSYTICSKLYRNSKVYNLFSVVLPPRFLFSLDMEEYCSLQDNDIVEAFKINVPTCSLVGNSLYVIKRIIGRIIYTTSNIGDEWITSLQSSFPNTDLAFNIENFILEGIIQEVKTINDGKLNFDHIIKIVKLNDTMDYLGISS